MLHDTRNFEYVMKVTNQLALKQKIILDYLYIYIFLLKGRRESQKRKAGRCDRNGYQRDSKCEKDPLLLEDGEGPVENVRKQ